ncbi:hypothetical protein BY458DRAFT_514920 [Sporodiniella umbellata]|nr:hypothetical protein BY458DRAFT_514920 [Sporodiniella umbellata]
MFHFTSFLLTESFHMLESFSCVLAFFCFCFNQRYTLKKKESDIRWGQLLLHNIYRKYQTNKKKFLTNDQTSSFLRILLSTSKLMLIKIKP